MNDLCSELSLSCRSDLHITSMKLVRIVIDNGRFPLFVHTGIAGGRSPKMFVKATLRPSLSCPEELRIDLLRPYQVFQLFQASKRPVFEDLSRHVNPLKQIIELFRPASRVPSAFEPGQMLANLLEGHAVAPIILTGSSK